jgi:hypothetical protein
MRMLGSHSEALWETTPSFSMDSKRGGGGLEVITEVSDFILYLYINDELPFAWSLICRQIR